MAPLYELLQSEGVRVLSSRTLGKDFLTERELRNRVPDDLLRFNSVKRVGEKDDSM